MLGPIALTRTMTNNGGGQLGHDRYEMVKIVPKLFSMRVDSLEVTTTLWYVCNLIPLQ